MTLTQSGYLGYETNISKKVCGRVINFDVVFDTVLCIVWFPVTLYTFFMQKYCWLGNTHKHSL